MSVSILGLLLLLIVLALPVALVIVVVKLLRSRPADPRDGGRCGQCGYSVRGIAALQCPECGADLREVGIVTPGSSRPRGAFLGVSVLWLIVMAVVTVYFMSLAISSVMYQRASHRMIFVQAPYWNTTIEAKQSGPDVVEMSVQGQGNVPVMTWEVARDEYQTSAGAVHGMNPTAIVAWMNQCGVSVQNPQDAQTLASADVVIAAAREVAAGMQAGFMNGPHVTAHPTHVMSVYRPRSKWIVLGITLLPVLLTLSGLLWLHRRLRPQWWEPAVVGVVGLFMLAIVAILALRV
ncbi:MAG: hypothetical protein IT445_01605 [Phycisphaeraceae bacterium]|nr:hypothetical protein [Phycisphaeraceae bacterium]